MTWRVSSQPSGWLPFAAEWDRTATFPSEALAEMGRLGMLGMVIPEEWDGAGADDVS